MLLINDPKQNQDHAGRSDWYPYYAGFSFDFARSLVVSANLPKGAVITDCWNGSGTTTYVANCLGYSGCGFDLNPVMVVVAKARLLSKNEHSSLEALATEIVAKALTDSYEAEASDPLLLWMCPQSANLIRCIEKAVQGLLLDHEHYQVPALRTDFHLLSGIAAFFYLCLFRTLRELLQRFVPSNPTWVRTPKDISIRVKPRSDTIVRRFLSEVLTLMKGVKEGSLEKFETGQASINIASSEALPLDDGSTTLALGSPPYCTRIDYAVATKPELAVLGYGDESFTKLRRQLLGTSTVPKVAPTVSSEWGPTCNKFLAAVKSHRSKASETYYYKNHLQYFDGIFKSLGEINRILIDDGVCVLVVQDSFYKDIKNDLPQIVFEMATSRGLTLQRRVDFSHSNSMAGLNPSVRLYRTEFGATESVLVFTRPPRSQNVSTARPK